MSEVSQRRSSLLDLYMNVKKIHGLRILERRKLLLKLKVVNAQEGVDGVLLHVCNFGNDIFCYL